MTFPPSECTETRLKMTEEIAECHFCGKGFCTSASRNRHIKGVHQNIRPYKCSVCDMTFKQKIHRQIHQRNVHGVGSGKKAPKNKISQVKSRNHLSGFSLKGRMVAKLPNQSRKHYSTSAFALYSKNNVAARTCDVCQTVFAFRQGMMLHRKVHFERNGSVKNPQISRGHSKASDTESLEECEKKNPESKAASQTKGSGGNHTCDVCQKEFPYRFVMLRHRRGHFPWKANQVGESISKDKTSSKTQHKLNHHQRGEFSCDICQRVFSFETSMKRHRRTVHFQNDAGSKKNRTSARGYKDKKSNIKSKLKCDICDKSFSYRGNMLMHRKLHFSNEKNPAEEDESPGDFANLNKEGESSTDKSAEPSMNHESHEEVVTHKESEDVACDICGKAYAYIRNLERHRRTHSQPLSDSKIEKESEPQNIVDEDEKERIDKPSMQWHRRTHSQPLSDSKIEKESEPQNIVVEDEKKKIDKMLRSSVHTKCLICHSKYTRHWGLKLHVESIHLNIRQWKCKLCGSSYTRKEYLLKHQKRKHPTMGTDQPFQYQRRAPKHKYGKHSNWHSARGLQKKSSTCPICFKIFWSRNNMLRHKKQMHGSELEKSVGEKEFPQDISEAPDVIRLPANASGGPVIEDEASPHFIKKKTALVDRTCEVCQKVFHYRKEMLTHRERSHYSSKESKRKKAPETLRKRHTRQERTCDVCGKLFPYRCEMLRHHRMKHSLHPLRNVNVMESQAAENDTPPSQVEAPSLKCPTGTSPDEREKIEEMLTSDCNICLICNKDFQVRRRFETHLNTIHLKLKPYKCIHCERTFALTCNLKTHLKNVHRDFCPANSCVRVSEPPINKKRLKNIECDICKKLFITNFSMIRHKRTHSAEEILPKGVSLNSHDEKNTITEAQTAFESEKDQGHMSNILALESEKDQGHMSNISARKYKCKKCDKSFLSRSVLVKHLYAYHVKRVRHECSQCGKKFRLKYHLANHMQKTHGRAPTVGNHTKSGNDPGMSEGVEGPLSKNRTISAPSEPSLYANKTESPDVETQRSDSSSPAVEIPKSRQRNSSGSSHSSWTPSVGSSPSVISSHRSSSTHSARSSPGLGSLANMKVYRCTMCRHIFTNSGDWREHLSQHLGGGTKIVHLSSPDCASMKCEDGEKPAGNTWSYSCPSCKMEIQGSLNLVIHIKGHMLEKKIRYQECM